MLEVYAGSIGTIYLTTYEDGVPVAPDSSPSVTIYDAVSGIQVVSGNPTLINNNYEGEYEYILPSSATQIDRTLKVAWSYSISGRQVVENEYLYVITPYATIDEIVSELGYSSRPEDRNYYSYDKIRSAERAARMIINNELGFSFGKEYSSTTAYGSNADVLILINKILSVDKIYENDELVLDVTNNYNNFGYDVEITETGYGIRIVPNTPGDDIDEEENFDYTGLTKGRFRDGYRYEIHGVLGWNYIPSEIKQCVFLLVNDLLCSDSIWRSKYVTKINSGQMSVELSGLSFTGTGNAIADSLINKFKKIQAVII